MKLHTTIYLLFFLTLVACNASQSSQWARELATVQQTLTGVQTGTAETHAEVSLITGELAKVAGIVQQMAQQGAQDGTGVGLTEGIGGVLLALLGSWQVINQRRNKQSDGRKAVMETRIAVLEKTNV